MAVTVAVAVAVVVVVTVGAGAGWVVGVLVQPEKSIAARMMTRHRLAMIVSFFSMDDLLLYYLRLAVFKYFVKSTNIHFRRSQQDGRYGRTN